MLRLYGIGREFESRDGIITFYLFLFTSFSKSLFIVPFATYSVNVNFRDYLYYVDRMNPLFPCDHGAATHSCIMHDAGRGTLCKNASGDMGISSLTSTQRSTRCVIEIFQF